MMNQSSPISSQLCSTSESNPVGQQQQAVNTPAASFANTRPNLPNQSIMMGPRQDYRRIGYPLYEASIRCDWNAAKAILDKKPELVRYSITGNGETALHIAVCVKRSKHSEKFVKNLVNLMDKEDLALENKYCNTALYLAAAAGDIKLVTTMVEKNRILTTIPGAQGDMMPLYTAAFYRNYEVVKYLYENSNDLCDDGWNPQNRALLLQRCVEGDMFDVALKIVKKHPDLVSWNLLDYLAPKTYAFAETKSNIMKRTINSVFALIGLMVGGYEKESEAFQLLKIIWERILKSPKEEIEDVIREQHDLAYPFELPPLQKLLSEHLDKLDLETNNLIGGPPDTSKHVKAFQLHKIISENLGKLDIEIENLIKQDNGDENLELRKLISEHIVSTRDGIAEAFIQDDIVSYLQELINIYITKMLTLSGLKRSYSFEAPFIAAKMGNTKFLVELISQYPDLIWKVNDDNHTIFHIAVKYRHEGIYNLLYEVGSMKNFITPIRDTHDNNMLHLAGKGASKERLADMSGAALQMQRELLWFKEIRNVIPPSYREQNNKDGLTPRELFTQEHEELIREGEKWMKGTASQCMVVAALIATIVFAAAFTIPGGYKQIDGIPIFYRKPIFVAFVVADAMSLFLSSTSLLTFLSILTSRYAERDFVESLPKKLMLGISTLFLSITAMMITFSVSFFILYHEEMKWIPILIGVFALVPIVLYVLLQYHVLADVIRSTYGSKYLFRPGKQLLYYRNPQV